MRIAESLVQHYFLDVEPGKYNTVKDALIASGNAMSRMQPKVKGWSLFVWLERSAIWAIRPVQVTSGLDTFLLDGGGMANVVDVAELVSCVYSPRSETPQMATSWESFSTSFEKPGVLFTCFLWVDWDALSRDSIWPENCVPARSKLLDAVQAALAFAISGACRRGTLREDIRVLVTGPTGDSDLVLYGYCQRSADLDACLYMLAQMGGDNLFQGATDTAATAARMNFPVFRSSRTEIAVSLDRYIEAVECVDGGQLFPEKLKLWFSDAFEGKLFPEIGLTRGPASVIELKDGISKTVSDTWVSRAVYGREDIVVEPVESCTFPDIIQALAALDSAAMKTASFPRRSSTRLCFENPLGGGSNPPSRRELFQIPQGHPVHLESVRLSRRQPLQDEVRPLLSMIEFLRNTGWREDLRILERMVERCVTLQKAAHLKWETVYVISSVFKRVGEMCTRILELEKRYSFRNDTESVERKELIAREIRMVRDELFNSGMSVDRVLSHHMKGVVPLLLSRGCEARGSEHIGSETSLSLGLGAVFGAPARRLRDVMLRDFGGQEDVARERMKNLSSQLVNVCSPIIYASHDQDFMIRPRLNLLRVPRWALWYPSATLHLLHELGHSLAVEGQLSFLMSKLLWRLRLGNLTCDCDHFEKALSQLGLPENRDELNQGKIKLCEVASLLFGTKEQYRHTDNPRLEPHLGASAKSLGEFEEIMADVVSRLFGYENSVEGDRRHLYDYLDYLAPVNARREQRETIWRLMRLMAAHIAVAQLRHMEQEKNFQPLSPAGLESLWGVMVDTVGTFRKQMTNWWTEYKERPENCVLPENVVRLLSTLPERFNEIGKHHYGGGRNVNFFPYAAYFVAVALRVAPLDNSKHLSLFKATQIWGNLVKTAWAEDPRDNMPGELDIVEKLKEGMVPEALCRRPERLPKMLAWHYRDNQRQEIPANVRLALSAYLCNRYLADIKQPNSLLESV